MYAPLVLPLEPPLRDHKPSELRGFFAWFVDEIPGRIRMLASLVTEADGCEFWRPDLSPQSLLDLGVWYSRNLETRERTAEEMAALRERVRIPGVNVSDREFTHVSKSIIADVGIYLGECVCAGSKSVHWDLDLRNKRLDSYGHPVLVGFIGGIAQDPLRKANVIAHNMADDRTTTLELRHVYETLVASATPGPG